MAKERSGYIGVDKDDKWFARVTFNSFNGKRKNVIRRAKNKAEAKTILKFLKRELENTENNFTEVSQLNFNNLADFYENQYLKPACFIEERKISGLRDWKRVKTFDSAIYTEWQSCFGRSYSRLIVW